MKWSALVFALCLASVGSRAALNADVDELKRTEQEQEQRLAAVIKRQKDLVKSVRQKSKTYHAVEQSSGTANYVWNEPRHPDDKRKKLERLLQVSIRENLREIESLALQEADLRSELEWVRLRLKETLEAQPAPVLAVDSDSKGHALDTAASFLRPEFRCAAAPVEGIVDQPVALLQDFGVRKDVETGIEWRSLGWWLGQTGLQVHACAAGIVVFSGKVPGRGRVIILDHGNGGVTLYANLNDDPQLSFPKGESVKAGAILGTPRDKLYFEVRRNGAAVNPREALASTTLSKIGL